jgi:hypothetical protein
MHPAPSVILFSVLSGLGFGMLAWLGIGKAANDRLVCICIFLCSLRLSCRWVVSQLHFI